MPFQEPAHKGMGHEEALIGKRIENMTQALRHPPQRTLGISMHGPFNKRLKRLLKAFPDLDRRLAAPSGRWTRPDRAGSSPRSAEPR